jgi:hypothetical protein
MTPINPGLSASGALPPQGGAPTTEAAPNPREQAIITYVSDRLDSMIKKIDVTLDESKARENKPIRYPCECLWSTLATFWRCIVSVFTRNH